MLEDDLGNDQLRLPIVLLVHVPPLASDITDAVVICDGQLLQVSEELLALALDALDMRLHVDVLVVQSEVLSIELLELCVDSVEVREDLDPLSREVVHVPQLLAEVSVQALTLQLKVLLGRVGLHKLVPSAVRVHLLLLDSVLESHVLISVAVEILLHGLIRDIHIILVVQKVLNASVVSFMETQLSHQLLFLLGDAI